MYFHLGQDFVLLDRTVIGLFDLDTAGASRRTQRFFRAAQAQGAVVDICPPGAVPRSFVVTDHAGGTVYLSQISARALKKRAAEGVRP